jgi:hypothetical protein
MAIQEFRDARHDRDSTESRDSMLVGLRSKTSLEEYAKVSSVLVSLGRRDSELRQKQARSTVEETEWTEIRAQLTQAEGVNRGFLARLRTEFAAKDPGRPTSGRV